MLHVSYGSECMSDCVRNDLYMPLVKSQGSIILLLMLYDKITFIIILYRISRFIHRSVHLILYDGSCEKNIGTAFCYGRTNLILMALRQRWIGVLLLIVLQMFWTFFYGDRSRYFINVLYVYKRSFSEVYRWQLWYYRLFCVFNKWKVHPIWNCCPTYALIRSASSK